MTLSSTPQSIEEEVNELRSLVAQSASGASGVDVKAILARLDDVEARVRTQRTHEDPGEVARKAILRELGRANKGKPGPLTMAQLIERCKMTKSAVHAHVNVLEKRGEVWERKTHDPVNGRPCTMVYLASAIKA
jgi:DNA-binding MarR family transcriptional regulator